jgi:hypothetical protein
MMKMMLGRLLPGGAAALSPLAANVPGDPVPPMKDRLSNCIIFLPKWSRSEAQGLLLSPHLL